MNYLGYNSLVILQISSTNPVPNPALDPVPNLAPKSTLVPALLRMRIINSHTSGSLQSIWKHGFSFYMSQYGFLPIRSHPGPLKCE